MNIVYVPLNAYSYLLVPVRYNFPLSHTVLKNESLHECILPGKAYSIVIFSRLFFYISYKYIFKKKIKTKHSSHRTGSINYCINGKQLFQLMPRLRWKLA